MIVKGNDKFSILREPLRRYYLTGNFPILISELKGIYDNYDKEIINAIYGLPDSLLVDIDKDCIIDTLQKKILSITVSSEYEERTLYIDTLGEYLKDMGFIARDISREEVFTIVMCNVFGVDLEDANYYNSTIISIETLDTLSSKISMYPTFSFDDIESFVNTLDSIMRSNIDLIRSISNTELHGVLLSIAWICNNTTLDLSKSLIDFLEEYYSEPSNINKMSYPFNELLTFSRYDSVAQDFFVQAAMLYEVYMKHVRGDYIENTNC